METRIQPRDSSSSDNWAAASSLLLLLLLLLLWSSLDISRLHSSFGGPQFFTPLNPRHPMPYRETDASRWIVAAQHASREAY